MGDLLRVCIAFLVICEIQAKRQFTIEILDLNHHSTDWNLIKFESHAVHGRKFVTYEFSLHRNVSDFDIKYNFDMLKKDNSSISLLKVTINGCSMLRSTPRINLMKVIFQEVFRTGNIPRNCAFMADTLYYVRNFTLHDDDYPPYTPLMEFQFKIEFLVGKKTAGVKIVLGRIRKL